MKYKHGLTMAAALSCAAMNTAQAAWPDDRPIEIIVGYSAGSATDLMARNLAPFLARYLGGHAQVLVIDKPGATGAISNAYVQHSKPDGYTLGTVNLPGFLFTPMYQSTPYQPDGMTLVARLVADPAVLIARDDNPAADLAGVVQAMRQKPGQVSFGNNGVGTNGHLTLLQLQQATHTQGIAVPFKGSGETSTALMGGQIDYAILSASEATMMRQNPVKVVAQFAPAGERGQALPTVPTAQEQGYAVLMTSERGLAGPKGLPSGIIDRLNAAISASLKDPDYRKAAANDLPVLAYLPGGQWDASMKDTEQRLRKLVPLMPKQ
ncbi:MAG TPA: tripartite tricarboxylate transporter substrate binding protein [Bordetella sp.]